jgi:hypothetical protein
MIGLLLFAVLPAADPGPLLAQIKQVGREGAGNAEAARAWRELVQQGPAALLPTLQAFDDADSTAANWLRSACESIVDRELMAKRPLPKDQLEAFVRDRNHAPSGRRLAYEWLVQVDPATPARLLPGMLDDPSVELRRDAVAAVLERAEGLLAKDDKDAARAEFRKALASARDRDQVDQIAKHLKGLGIEVDLASHFGFIKQWQLLAPFDNTGGIGFEASYPPEKGVDLKATYAGKKGLTCAWKPHTTTHAYGIVDLNKVIGKHMGVVGYAFAAVDSPREQPVEIRAGSKNAVKIFLNGNLVHFREEYHHGMRMDQHIGRGTLKQGRHEILIKVCQNEQTDAWAQEWEFQLRVCDAVGGGIALKVLDEPVGGRKE